MTTKSEWFFVSFPFDISLRGSIMLYKYLYNAVMYYFWMVCIDFPVHECIWQVLCMIFFLYPKYYMFWVTCNVYIKVFILFWREGKV